MWKIYVQILTLFCQNLSASGGLRSPDPHQGLCPWAPLGALPPDSRYRLALHALAICPRPLSPLLGVKLRPCRHGWKAYILMKVATEAANCQCVKTYYTDDASDLARMI